jgi:hypothetical protein
MDIKTSHTFKFFATVTTGYHYCLLLTYMGIKDPKGIKMFEAFFTLVAKSNFLRPPYRLEAIQINSYLERKSGQTGFLLSGERPP